RVRRTVVELRARGATTTAVEGVPIGSRVVVYPPEALRDGMRVR
ncbi:MAG: hypothetical protein RL340_737, partial [Gemmatimonadota bacterium]